jgi:hypothetical protein
MGCFAFKILQTGKTANDVVVKIERSISQFNPTVSARTTSWRRPVMARFPLVSFVFASVLVLFASGLCAQTYAMGQPSTAALTPYNTSSSYNMGYAFTTTASNVTVTHLTAACPDTLAKQIHLWDSTAPSAPIATVTTPTAATSGAWRSAALATPVLLVANRQYRVSTLTTNYYLPGASAPWAPTGTINYVQGYYLFSTTVGYPTTAYTGPLGLSDIGYTTGPGLTASATAGSAQSVVTSDTGPTGTGRNIGTFTVSANSSGACTLNSMTLTASGTGNDNTAFTEVGIFEDTNSSTTYDGADVRYGGTFTVYPSDNGSLTFSASTAFAASQSRRYFVVVKLNGTPAANGQTFNTQVSAISVTGGSASGTPSTTMNGLVITGPVLTVAATAGTATTVYADATGSGGNGIQSGTFTITNSAVTTADLTSISIAASGSANDSTAYSQVSLYEDTNFSGAYDVADTLYGSAFTAFASDNGTLVFSAAQTFTVSQSRRYFVVVKLAGSTLASPGQTLNTQVSTLGVSGTTTAAGVPSAVMNGITIQTPTVTYTDGSAASAATAYPASGNYVLQKFTAAYAAGPANSITSITVGAQGSGNDATAYSSVQLYLDSNTNGTYDVGVDTLLNSQSAFAADNGNVVFTISEAYTPAVSKTFFVVVAFNNVPTAGNTFQCRVSAATYGYTGTTSTSLPAPAAFTAGLTISQPAYNVTDNSPATQGNAYLGGSDYLMQSFTIAYPSGPTNTLTGITLTAGGTGNDQSHYSAVELYRDANANGTYDVGVDALVASQTSFASDNGTLTFTIGGADAQFTAGTSRQYFVVVAFNLSGVTNTTFVTQLTGISGTSFGATLSGVPSPAGGPCPGLLLRGNNVNAVFNGPGTASTISSADQGPGNLGLVLLDVTLTTVNLAWTINTMTFTANGSGNDATAFSFLSLYNDSNSSGTFDAADTMAVAAAGTAFSANDGSYVATLVNTAVGATSSRRFFLVVKLGGSAVTGNTFNADLTSMTGIAPTGGSMVGLPTTSSTAFIVGAAALSVTLGPASPGAATVEGGALFSYTMAQIRFSASNNNCTVNGVTLTNSGSGSWVTHLQVPGVELFLDDGNGVYDGAPTDTLLFSGSANVPGMNCTFTAPVNVGNAQFEDVWVRVHFAANAGTSIPETYRTAIAAATDVNATGAVTVLGTPAPTSALCSVVLFNVASMTPSFDTNSGGANIVLSGSGFLAPLTLTINGVLCPGSPVINSNGTQVTGLRVPAGSGANLVVVLNNGALGAKTLTQTFTYTAGGTIGSGGTGGGGGGGGCSTGTETGAYWLAALALLVASGLMVLRRRAA